MSAMLTRAGSGARWHMLFVAVLAGCGATEASDAGSLASDAGADASTVRPPIDAGASDASVIDAGLDSGVDAGGPDAGADAGVDAGAPMGCTALGSDGMAIVHEPGDTVTRGSIVWDGSRYAMVWSTLTSRSPVIYSIWFAQADRAGALVPGSLRRLFADAQLQFVGEISLGDGEYGLSYTRGAESGLTVANRTWFARLDLDGNPIAGTGVRLSDEHAPHGGSSIAWSPTLRQWAVAWQGTQPRTDGFVNRHVYLTRLTDAGVTLGTTPALDALVTTTFYGSRALAWTGDRFALALAEFVSIPNTRVSVVELDPMDASVTRRIIVDEIGRPGDAALATDGTTYGVVWTDLSGSPLNRSFFRVAVVGGDVLGSAAPLGEPGVASTQPTVVTSGGMFRVVYHQSTTAWRARFDLTGAPLEAATSLFTDTTPAATWLRAATDDCNDAIIWSETRGGPPGGPFIRLHVSAAAPL